MLSGRLEPQSEHILKMATLRLGLVIVFLPTVALCLASSD